MLKTLYTLKAIAHLALEVVILFHAPFRLGHETMQKQNRKKNVKIRALGYNAAQT